MLRRSFLILAVGTLLAACGGDSTRPEAGLAGSYTLRTVNGNILPWRFLQFDDDWMELTSGGGSVNADGTYSLTFSYRAMDSGEISTFTESSVGTYTRNGNAITFTDEADGSIASGTVTGGQISVTDEDGVVYVFQRN